MFGGLGGLHLNRTVSITVSVFNFSKINSCRFRDMAGSLIWNETQHSEDWLEMSWTVFHGKSC